MARSNKKATSARLVTIAVSIAAFIAATGIPLYLFFFDTHAPEIKDLLCDNQKENAVATRARPVFSWTFQDQDRGSSQESVCIKVGETAGDSAMWHGHFEQKENQIQYRGRILENEKTYFWSVQAVDNDGDKSQVSGASFTTKWQDHRIISNITIQDQQRIDSIIATAYLKSVYALAVRYRNAQSGKLCRYKLAFQRVSAAQFQLDIRLEALNGKPLHFNENSSLAEAENAFLALMENAYKQLEQQLGAYHQ